MLRTGSKNIVLKFYLCDWEQETIRYSNDFGNHFVITQDDLFIVKTEIEQAGITQPIFVKHLLDDL